MASIDHKAERASDLNKIKDSVHPRKVVVAGPGTGKSFLFSEIIKKRMAEGKSSFLAITFIGKLGDALADDLCGLAKTTTLHGFAREFVLRERKDWIYYPAMYKLISEDLKAEGIAEFEVGDENYKRKSEYYKAVGDEDVVYYALQICKSDKSKVPVYDLILVDEYQDFNATESELVDVLAERNEIVIVGDDDQALYAFKGSSPTFIREKHDSLNTNFESHTLRFCSRCTEVIVKYFHGLVAQFKLNEPGKGRIQKDYICYVPDKEGDSKANPKIHHIKDCPPGMIAYKIKGELQKLVDSQKIKSVLIIGEGGSCKSLLQDVSRQIKSYGFQNVDCRSDGSVLPVQQDVTDAYKFLAKDSESLLGWRILQNPIDAKLKKRHLKNAKTLKAIIDGTPSTIRKIKSADLTALENDIEKWDSISTASESADPNESPTDRGEQNEQIRQGMLIQQLKSANTFLQRPLRNLEITICNILNSKGLGADVVFVIGFDQGKFPSKTEPTESEVYQMLVGITRAKKRIYLISTINKTPSIFLNCLTGEDLDIEVIKQKGAH